MAEKIQIVCSFTQQQYRALLTIAARKSEATQQAVQAHHLIEDLVERALTGKRRPARSARPKRERQPKRLIDRDELRRLHADGLLDDAIGEAMGFSRSAIGAARREMGLESHRQATTKVRIDMDELRHLHALKFNDRQIGLRLGVSHQTICTHRNRLGLPKNSAQGRPKKYEETAA